MIIVEAPFHNLGAWVEWNRKRRTFCTLDTPPSPPHFLAAPRFLPAMKWTALLFHRLLPWWAETSLMMNDNEFSSMKLFCSAVFTDTGKLVRASLSLLHLVIMPAESAGWDAKVTEKMKSRESSWDWGVAWKPWLGKGSKYLEDPLPVVLKWSIDRVVAEQMSIKCSH